MSKSHKPVAGSRAYWPKKRAKNIYSRIKTHKETKEALPLDFAAYKAGMTRVLYVDKRKDSITEGQEVAKAATVLDSPSLVVCGIKTYSTGSGGLETAAVVWAENVSKDLSRKTRIPKKISAKGKLGTMEKQLEKVSDVRLLVHTKPKESGLGKKKPELFEVSLGGSVQDKWTYAKQKIGGELKAADIFKEGDWIDVKAVDKGKGFQGVVKRFGVTIRSRKNKKKRRHIGNLGPRNVARVLPGAVAMAGQMGFQTRTEYNKKILKIGSSGDEVTPKGGFLRYGLVKGNYLLLEGSIPGPRKRLVMIRRAVRSQRTPEPVELKKIVLESQQGV